MNKNPLVWLYARLKDAFRRRLIQMIASAALGAAASNAKDTYHSLKHALKPPQARACQESTNEHAPIDGGYDLRAKKPCLVSQSDIHFAVTDSSVLISSKRDILVVIGGHPQIAKTHEIYVGMGLRIYLPDNTSHVLKIAQIDFQQRRVEFTNIASNSSL